MPRWAASILAASALVAGGCESSPYVIDPFPVFVEYATYGVPHVQAEAVDVEGLGFAEAVIDSGTPVTRVDGPDLARQRTRLDLISQTVPRARWNGAVVLQSPLGGVGLAGQELAARVIIGGDLLRQLDLRLDPDAGEAYFFPYLAGDDDVLGRECSAVLPAPPSGGGEYELGGGTVSYAATRLVVGACLNPDPPQREVTRPAGEGGDALLVVATGLPISVISASAYERARAATDPAFADLPEAQLHLPGSAPGQTTTVRLGSLSWLGLAADIGDRRGPCEELLGSRMMDLGGCRPGEPCHCRDPQRDGELGTLWCPAGASLEIAGPVVVAVIADADPILQGLRAELSPKVATVDGFLGMNVLMSVVTDLDYPNGRVVLRCAKNDVADVCLTRPTIREIDDVKVGGQLRPCLRQQVWDTSVP